MAVALKQADFPEDIFPYESSTNWFSRMVNSFRSPTIRKQTMVHPCVIDGQQTLVHERGLKQNDPFSYRQVVNYARRYGYQIKEDQRADFIEGIKRVKNKGQANIMPIMVLGASLLTQNAFAKSAHKHNHHHDAEVTAQHELGGSYLDMNASFSDQNHLLSNLLTWINGHSSYSYNLDEMPKVKRASTKEIAQVAFGKELPKALDLNTFQIFGLYNFNEKAIYLHDSIDLDTEKGKAILLHELVHFLQYQHGEDKQVKCKNELESLAYLLEAKYLKDHNQHSGFNMNHVRKISQCRGA